MESTLLSPSGTRYPRTPLNEESVNVMRKMDALLSNKKPDAQDALKMPKMPDAKIQDTKIQDAPNTDALIPEERHALFDLDVHDQNQLMNRLICHSISEVG